MLYPVWLPQYFESRWFEAEVESAVWKPMGDAAAAGRMLVDLTEVDLSRTTLLAFLSFPTPLPSSLEATEAGHEERRPQEQEVDGIVLDVQVVIPRFTFGASVLATAEEYAHFHRNLAAVTDVLTDKSFVV